jgi:hypothetical protein
VSLSNSGPNDVAIKDTNAIVLGTINVANNLAVTGVGITQTAGGITVGGISTFNAGAGVIALTTATNDFSGAVSLNKQRGERRLGEGCQYADARRLRGRSQLERDRGR